ncbi:MAG TPA: hypothetical protein VJH34_02380 [archaeon]|nr:hypothetical protein [archaeon]
MVDKRTFEKELKKAKSELFNATSLQQMKFIQKKIVYLQSKVREGI